MDFRRRWTLWWLCGALTSAMGASAWAQTNPTPQAKPRSYGQQVFDAIQQRDTARLRVLAERRTSWSPAVLEWALRTGDTATVTTANEVSGHTVSALCLTDAKALRQLLTQPAPFAEEVTKLGLPLGPCQQRPALAERALLALADDERFGPLLGQPFVRAQQVMHQWAQAAGHTLQKPGDIWLQSIAEHRPDLLSLALIANAPSAAEWPWLAHATLRQRAPAALAALHRHGLPADTVLPNGQPLPTWARCQHRIWQTALGLPATAAETTPCQAPGSTPQTPPPRQWVGSYRLDGAHEAAGALQLHADGTFKYALTYGAIDQLLEGRWQQDQDWLVLTSTDAPPSEALKLFQASHAPDIKGLEVRVRSATETLDEVPYTITGATHDDHGMVEAHRETGWAVLPAPATNVGRWEHLTVGVPFGRNSIRWTTFPITRTAQGLIHNRYDFTYVADAFAPASTVMRFHIQGQRLSVGDENERAAWVKVTSR